MIRHLPAPPRRSEGLVGRVFEQMRHEFGVLAEALTLHHPIPNLLAVTWACLRETVLAPGRLSRPVKEMVALGISHANRCPYCIDAHGMMLHALGAGDEERRMFAGETPRDPRLAAFAAWGASTSGPEPLAPPFSAEERPEAVATLCCFQYINRLATVLLGDSPLPTPALWIRGPVVRLVGKTLAGTARRALEPGAALALVPEEIPRDVDRWNHLGWTAGNPLLAEAFAAFAEVTDRAVEPVLHPEGRAAVREALAGRQAHQPPLGRDWLEDAVQELEPGQRPAVRLALLAALAPHRATDQDVDAVCATHPGAPALLGLLSWTAHEAAKAISARIESPGL